MHCYKWCITNSQWPCHIYTTMHYLVGTIVRFCHIIANTCGNRLNCVPQWCSHAGGGASQDQRRPTGGVPRAREEQADSPLCVAPPPSLSDLTSHQCCSRRPVVSVRPSAESMMGNLKPQWYVNLTKGSPGFPGCVKNLQLHSSSWIILLWLIFPKAVLWLDGCASQQCIVGLGVSSCPNLCLYFYLEGENVLVSIVQVEAVVVCWCWYFPSILAFSSAYFCCRFFFMVSANKKNLQICYKSLFLCSVAMPPTHNKTQCEQIFSVLVMMMMMFTGRFHLKVCMNKQIYFALFHFILKGNKVTGRRLKTTSLLSLIWTSFSQFHESFWKLCLLSGPAETTD